MTWSRFVWRNLGRHPLRSVFTTLAIALSIFLVCAVLSLPAALDEILARATSNTRISVHHEAGLTYWLPMSFVAKVKAVPGVAVVNHYSWFGGLYDRPEDMFPNFAVDPETVGAMWPDYHIDPRALERFKRIRNAAIVGHQTMRKFGWKVGDVITLKGTAFPVDLTLEIVGEVPPPGNPVVLMFQHKYLDESLTPRPGFPFGGLPIVGMIWVKAERPEEVPRIMADIDALFRNSEAETAAETEKSFFQNFMSSLQGFIRVILAVGFLVVAAVVLIAANTAAMGVRERTAEIAVLKSLGFRRGPILTALLAESTLQAVVGGCIGAVAAYALFAALRAAGGGMGGLGQLLGPMAGFYMSPTTAAQGVLVAFVVGIVSGAVPAWSAARMNVVEALRRLF
jgi:putative ABC transport system permease protein